MDDMRKMLVEELETTYGDEDAVVDMGAVKDAVTSRIAVVESLGMMD